MHAWKWLATLLHKYAVHACMVHVHAGSTFFDDQRKLCCMYYLFAAPHVTIFSLSHNEMFEGDSGSVTCPEGAYCLSGQCFCYGGRVGPNCDICKSKLLLMRCLHFTYWTWWHEASWYLLSLNAAYCFSNVTCFNNGSCGYMNGTSVCECRPPFTGDDCTQQLPSECCGLTSFSFWVLFVLCNIRSVRQVKLVPVVEQDTSSRLWMSLTSCSVPSCVHQYTSLHFQAQTVAVWRVWMEGGARMDSATAATLSLEGTVPSTMPVSDMWRHE